MTVTIEQLVFDPAKGHDVLMPFATLDYDPASYSTKGGAAKGFYRALRKVAEATGSDPDSIFIDNPEESENRGYGRNWRVVWEEGPFEWAIQASFQVTGPWGFTEPYYSFDLCFTD
jgi:hypothetical protein